LEKKAIKEKESSEATDLLVRKSRALDGMVPNAGMYKILPSCVNGFMPSLVLLPQLWHFPKSGQFVWTICSAKTL
jgi:hypothetical protein